MKLVWLQIKKYKNLEEFNISFENTTRNINYVVGKNGSGKSNLLEAIAIIFRDITANQPPSFTFELLYEITVDDKTESILIKGEKDGSYLFPQNFDVDKHLPHSVVTYYAGIDNKYKNLVTSIEKTFIDNLKNSIFKPRILFNVEFKHYNYILISLLSAERYDEIQESPRSMLYERCNIVDIDNITFEIAKRKNIRGVTKRFLDIFLQCSKNQETLSPSSSKVTYDQKAIQNLREVLGAERDILKVLDILNFAEIIKETNVSLNMQYDESEDIKCIDSLSLSEGEKQYITLLGLSEFFGHKETVYLLDEPDAFLHPSWQANLNSDLIQFNSKEHFVITTHSPHVIQSIQKENIFMLKNGNLLNTPYTLGRDINSILLEIMDTGIRPETFKDEIKAIYRLIDNREFSTAEKKINELSIVMGENDIEILRMRNILLFECDE